MSTMPNRLSPAKQSAAMVWYLGSKTCRGICAWGKRTVERGNMGSRCNDTLLVCSLTFKNLSRTRRLAPTHQPVDASRTGHEAGPLLDV
jgi:hypothetical protein